MPQPPQRDLFQTLISVVIVAALLALSYWVMRPFLPALVWATMIVVATWRILKGVQARAWGKRWIAVALLTIALLLVLIVPLSLAVNTIVVHADDIVGWAKGLDELTVPAPPSWVAGLPLVGERVDAAWRELAGASDLYERLAPYLGKVVSWLVAQLGSFGTLAVHFLLTVVLSALLWAHGETAAAAVTRFAQRVGGERGANAVTLAGQAIRSVAVGVVVTALLQSILGGIGIAIAGVPFAAVITAIMFLLAVAQIGAAPVLVCCVIWLFWKGHTGWGSAMIVWTVFVSAIDNVVRPILIKRGANLPLLLIFAGVIGGLISFGIIGLFIGPMVLAVTYTLVASWMERGPQPDPV